MHIYTEKVTKPATVRALQYVAPDGLDEAGNVDELKAAADVREQAPWNPLGGQHAVLVVDENGNRQLLTDGEYLVIVGDKVSVSSAEDFEAKYEPRAGAATDTPVTTK